MGYPTYGGYSLDNENNIITESIKGDRDSVDRNVIDEPLVRREGAKILGDEFGVKEFTVEGTLYDTTVTGFRGILDEFKQNLAEVEQQLQFTSDRYYVATTTKLNVTQNSSDISIGKFQAEFLAVDPFAYGTAQSVDITVASGIVATSGTVTISGTVYARPTISYITPVGPTGTGATTISGITISHVPSGTTVTWSGTTSTRPMTYSGTVSFNYDTLTVYSGTTSQDWTGFFPVWEPGANAFVTTVSGQTVGGTIRVNYTPRFL